MAKFNIRRLAEDLLQLEINTIISSEISAEKRPDKNRVTLYKLAGDYSNELIEMCEKYQSGVRTHNNIKWKYGGIASFDEIKNDARALEKELLAMAKAETNPEQLDKLERSIRKVGLIGDNAVNMVSMFFAMYHRTGDHDQAEVKRDLSFLNDQRKGDREDGPAPPHESSKEWNNDLSYEEINKFEDLELLTQDTARLQKAWDIGTEEIVMQTVISLDGDVTTRIARSLVDEPKKFVIEAHEDSIGQSMKFWQDLMNAVQNAVNTLGDLITGGDKADSKKASQ